MNSYLSPGVLDLVNVFNKEYVVERETFLEDLSTLMDSSAEIRDEEWFRSAAILFSKFSTLHSDEARQKLMVKDLSDFSWLSEHESFVNYASSAVTQSDREVYGVEALLVMFSILERSLGNIHAQVSPLPVPSLMRQLVCSMEVSQTLGKDISTLLMSICGSPKSLNVRNLVWHGFLLPGELDETKFILGLVMLASLIGQRIPSVTRRPGVHIKVLNPPELSRDLLSRLLPTPLARRESFVTRVFEALEARRYYLALVLILPELEFLLRWIFAKVNECPERVLTAENDAYYTTMSEVLAEKLEDGTPNQAIDYLGLHLVEYFYDLFVLPDGPRIRDRISHGEIESENYELESWCNSVVLSYGAVLEITTGCDDTKPFFTLVKRVKLRFHPFHFFLASLESSVQGFYNLASCECFALDAKKLEVEVPDLVTTAKSSSTLSTEMLSTPEQTAGNSDLVLISFLKTFRPKTLYRHPKEYRIVSVMRKISTTIDDFFRQSLSNVLAKSEALSRCSLSRRKEHSYRKMMQMLPLISSALLDTQVCVASLLTVFDSDLEEKFMAAKLKRMLKCCENICSCTAVERNNWDKANDMKESLMRDAGELLSSLMNPNKTSLTS